jgi:hypothetical protein
LVTAVEGYVSRNLRSIFIQDPNDADGRYAGVKLVYNPAQAQFVPEVGMFVDVSGEIIEYRGSNQIQYATITRNGSDTAVPQATVVNDMMSLYRNQPTTRAYEGTLVRLENVTVSSRCTEDTQQRDHRQRLDLRLQRPDPSLHRAVPRRRPDADRPVQLRRDVAAQRPAEQRRQLPVDHRRGRLRVRGVQGRAARRRRLGALAAFSRCRRGRARRASADSGRSTAPKLQS